MLDSSFSQRTKTIGKQKQIIKQNLMPDILDLAEAVVIEVHLQADILLYTTLLQEELPLKFKLNGEISNILRIKKE